MAATVTCRLSLLLGTVGLVVAAAWGVVRWLRVVEEPDTTAYLLRGANGDALRAAIGRRYAAGRGGLSAEVSN